MAGLDPGGKVIAAEVTQGPSTLKETAGVQWDGCFPIAAEWFCFSDMRVTGAQLTIETM